VYCPIGTQYRKIDVMQVELKSYIVAFIDLLGFSSMVSHDCETANGGQKFIESLYECHIETKNLKEQHPNLQLIQFSDSVVFALPFSIDNYSVLIKLIANYQYNLLSKGILCRGGMSYGKHFYTEDFLFSHGMIEAYRLESQIAVTPRVIISRELLDLVDPRIDKKLVLLPIYQENDGVHFINYFDGKPSKEAWSYVIKTIPSEFSSSPSIRNKQVWLFDFYNHNYPTDNHRKIEKFT
jgi:hypothetical protein